MPILQFHISPNSFHWMHAFPSRMQQLLSSFIQLTGKVIKCFGILCKWRTVRQHAQVARITCVNVQQIKSMQGIFMHDLEFGPIVSYSFPKRYQRMILGISRHRSSNSALNDFSTNCWAWKATMQVRWSSPRSFSVVLRSSSPALSHSIVAGLIQAISRNEVFSGWTCCQFPEIFHAGVGYGQSGPQASCRRVAR